MINYYLLVKDYTQKTLQLLDKDFEAVLVIIKTIFADFVQNHHKFQENEVQGPNYSLCEEDEILLIFTYLRYFNIFIYFIYFKYYIGILLLTFFWEIYLISQNLQLEILVDVYSIGCTMNSKEKYLG